MECDNFWKWDGGRVIRSRKQNKMAVVALPITPSRTPKKTERISFSPSGDFICICCQKVTLTKRRICPWKDGNLSSAGQLLQSVIPLPIQQTDFQEYESVSCAWKKLKVTKKRGRVADKGHQWKEKGWKVCSSEV